MFFRVDDYLRLRLRLRLRDRVVAAGRDTPVSLRSCRSRTPGRSSGSPS
ncbi:hypothetical protein R1Y80_29440 [Streptomyces sp. JL1001]|uniref:Uncharacterized protein n=1 Tax=Streptomyces sp. JL1001 TaxID=3078227 RepID=A0AAU8KNC9_9ACTN